MATILITGGTGLIGRHLSKKLKDKGHSVSILGRTSEPNAEIPMYTWDIEKNEMDDRALTSVDYIIHLAGANIGDSAWTEERKKIIVDSRVNSGRLLLNKVKQQRIKLKGFISASAIGYYGAITSDKIFNETDASSNDFLGDVCRQWEQTADEFENLGIRVVKIRTGIVLSKQGGSVAKLIIPIKLGIGSAIGTGKQYMPWIHIDDLCAIYIKTIEDQQMNGAYNAVAPDHKTNGEFMETLARVLKKPFWFPHVPSFLPELIFGKMSDLILKGSRVSSEKIIKAGFQFKFPNLETALVDLFGKNKP